MGIFSALPETVITGYAAPAQETLAMHDFIISLAFVGLLVAPAIVHARTSKSKK
jgi:hypothetical protein